MRELTQGPNGRWSWALGAWRSKANPSILIATPPEQFDDMSLNLCKPQQSPTFQSLCVVQLFHEETGDDATQFLSALCAHHSVTRSTPRATHTREGLDTLAAIDFAASICVGRSWPFKVWWFVCWSRRAGRDADNCLFCVGEMLWQSGRPWPVNFAASRHQHQGMPTATAHCLPTRSISWGACGLHEARMQAGPTLSDC